MGKYLLTIFVLVKVMACRSAPKPLSIYQLQFPDPERDAIAANGIEA
jgi:hypothetical protein